MESQSVERIEEVIAYIESHLSEKLDLDQVAAGVHCSKYHLHRMFTNTVGITIHDYVQRRRLTEAAKLLVCSEKSILEIALIAGFESQQAFTDRFKTMYKKTPAKYREQGNFYPLQSAFSLNRNPSTEKTYGWGISYVILEDIPDWMNFVSLVIDGFPGFREEEHMEKLRGYIARKEALILRDGSTVIGAAACSKETGSIDFLGIHPQYRRSDAAKALLNFIMNNLIIDSEISITTFREGDRADTGQRREYQQLGFAESELLTEFGYPTQRLILSVKREISNGGEL